MALYRCYRGDVTKRDVHETRPSAEQRRAFNTSLTHDLNRAEIEAIRASGEVHSKGVVPTDRFSHGNSRGFVYRRNFAKRIFSLLPFIFIVRAISLASSFGKNNGKCIQYCLLYRLSPFKRKLLLFVDRIAGYVGSGLKIVRSVIHQFFWSRILQKYSFQRIFLWYYYFSYFVFANSRASIITNR